MVEISGKNFGLAIAYLLPGFIVLWTGNDLFGEPQTWFGTCLGNAPTVGGFLYATLASLAAGLTLSAIRWLILDPIHHKMGIARPDWDFSKLGPNLAAFEGAVQNHYRYYQFFGSMFLISIVAGVRFAWLAVVADLRTYSVLKSLLGSMLFFVASRDSLTKYYVRSGELLGQKHGREQLTWSDDS
jgi:hypothetical protein